MNIKLTLKLEQDIIEKAKGYAKSRSTSLSKIVENYLDVAMKSRASTIDPPSPSATEARILSLLLLPADPRGTNCAPSGPTLHSQSPSCRRLPHTS